MIYTPEGYIVPVACLLVIRGALAAGQNVAYRVGAAHVVEPSSLFRVYSQLGIASNVGFIVGPALAGLAGPSYAASLWVSVALHAGSAATGAIASLAPSPAPRSDATPIQPAASQPGSIQDAPSTAMSQRRDAYGFYAAYFLQWVLLQQLTLAFTYYCERALQRDDLGGSFFSIQGALIIPFMLIVGQRLKIDDPSRQARWFVGGCFIVAASYLTFGLLCTHAPWAALIVFAVLLTAAEAVSAPMSDVYIAQYRSSTSLGAAFSTASLLQSLGMAAGAGLGAAAIQWLEGRGGLLHFWELVGGLGALLLVPAWLLVGGHVVIPRSPRALPLR
jgi:hypothetical protein